MDKKQTTYDSEITELETQRDRIGGKLSALYQLRAETLCPYKVGDLITSKDGKRRAEITKITASNYSFVGYKLRGRWLKKDGTLGTQHRELYWFDWA